MLSCDCARRLCQQDIANAETLGKQDKLGAAPTPGGPTTVTTAAAPSEDAPAASSSAIPGTSSTSALLSSSSATSSTSSSTSTTPPEALVGVALTIVASPLEPKGSSALSSSPL